MAVWPVVWVGYELAVEAYTCDRYQPSEDWAGYIGVALVLLAAILAFRRRRDLLFLFWAFLAVYVAALYALWKLSPAIWGPVPHGCGSF